MKRLQISLEPELDAELGRLARAEGVSKAEIVRRSLRERAQPLPPLEEDPLFGGMVGVDEGEPDDSVSVDDVVYPP
jgi:ribbon-helix-helix CopG family protein